MIIKEITAEKNVEIKIIRLAVYCRVSSDSDDQLHSFAAQIRYYTEYVRKHPEYELVDIYADDGITGTSMLKRGEMCRLLRDCKKGKIDRIIVKSISRFARNTEELLETIRMLKEIGVSVYFEEQGIDTDKMNMEMLVTFPGMAAQKESETISGNVRWSVRKRMESGEYNCTYPAFGFYQVDGELSINDKEAEIVRKIFSLYLQGLGKQAIANKLNEENAYRRKNQKQWYASTVDYILNNERYMGDALLQKKYTTDTLPFRQVRNNGEKPQYYVENSNVAIVSKEIYMAVQNLQAERRTNTDKKQTSYLLAGMLYCPECGRAFRRQQIKGNIVWICNGKAARATECQSRRVREDAVYDTFMAMLTKLTENRQYLLTTLIRQIETMQDSSSEVREKIREIDKQIADLGAQNLVITRLHTNGILDSATYSAQNSEISNKLNALRIERRKKLSEDEDNELLEDLRTLDDIIEESENQIEFSEEIFGEIVEKIIVQDNANLTFQLLGGIELTEQIREKGRCKSV